jgi:AcrR family transcriptional regulator
MTTETPTAPSRLDTRERLLQAALSQFTEHGYAAASIREICAAACVTKPVLYYYFGSKEGLYQQLMGDAYALFESRMAEFATLKGDARRRLISFCEGLFDIGMEQIPLVRLIYSIYFGPPQGAPPFNLERYYDRMLEVASGMVRDGIEAGEIRAGNVNNMTWALLASFNTALEEQLCHTSPRIDRAGMVAMLNMVFDGIAAPAGNNAEPRSLR